MMPALFILIVLIYLFASGYIAARVCRVFKRRPRSWRIAVWVIVLLLDFSFFLQRLVGADCVWLNRIVYVVSTTWMPVVLYLFMILVVLDVARYILKITRGEIPYHTPASVKTGVVLTALLLVWGYITAISPEETRYSIYTDKLPAGEEFTIALVSDLHTGYAVREGDIDKMVGVINSANADVTLICGDLIDGDISPVIKEETLAPLTKLRSPMGVFAVMGNHEYMEDGDRAAEVIRSIGNVVLLRDSMADVGSFRIIGRDDLTLARLGRTRLDISAFEPSDSLFTIVMDHQPGAVMDAVDINADLSLSGHTHAGQIWPMNLITERIYTIDYGFSCYGSTGVVVTSGYGTWGPRIRLGTQAEVVLIDIFGTRK